MFKVSNLIPERPFSSVFIVDFGQVNVSWDINYCFWAVSAWK